MEDDVKFIVFLQFEKKLFGNRGLKEMNLFYQNKMKRKFKTIIGIMLSSVSLSACNPAEEELKVFQINVWQETTMVKDGFSNFVNEIVRLNPDVVLLSEVRNYGGVQFVPRLIDSLKVKGLDYYGKTSATDCGVLTKYKMLQQECWTPEEYDSGSVEKVKMDVNGHTVIVYSAHLDYKDYACYLPRGYDQAWQKMDAPIVDAELISKINRDSWRDEATSYVISDAKKEKDAIIIYGGDFNEPSHLDWDERTEKMYDHHGAVIRWDTSSMLEKEGYCDSYREKYPDPVTHPGFTYPADNPAVDMQLLDWTPGIDSRDRIDFIYYKKSPEVHLQSIVIVGPSGTIRNSDRTSKDSEDRFLEPLDVWPTDHKGLLAVFKIK